MKLDIIQLYAIICTDFDLEVPKSYMLAQQFSLLLNLYITSEHA